MSSGKILVAILTILLLWGILTGVTACRELVQGVLADNVRLAHDYQTLRAMPIPAAVAVPDYQSAMAEAEAVNKSRWAGLGYLAIGVLLAFGYFFSAMTGHKGLNGLLDSIRKLKGKKPAARPPQGQGMIALPPDHPDAWAYNPNQLQPPAPVSQDPPAPAAGSWLVPRSGGQGGL